MVKISDEVTSQEASMSFLGFSVSQRVPIRMRKVEVVCEKAPPPKPKPKLGFYDIVEVEYTLEEQTLIMRNLTNFNLLVRFSDALARVESQSASLLLEAASGGQTKVLRMPLAWDGDARFKLADPGSLSGWLQTEGAQAQLRSMSITGVYGRNQAYGEGRFGYTGFLDRTPIFGSTGALLSRALATSTLDMQLTPGLN